ncbi:MAG TPA: 2,3-bisphosphoglycerate-independent phosphoglycerate mutase [Euryarchaeota archaeon]|nr:2,3-bisphosphoglycerate-independent phosphoglycerate mutase [Euryarchaeota archaeon]
MDAPVKLKNRVVLAILDGWGLGPNTPGNAIARADTPNMSDLLRRYNVCKLKASGEAIGLPPGQMGNSEVGHLNLGAGRTVFQDFLRINRSITDGTFFQNETITSLLRRTKEHNGELQILGLLSDGGVHSHIEHILALFKLARSYNVNISLHAFLDGRDTLPKSAKEYIINAEKALEGIGKISSISGRYYSMDRDRRWERTKMAFDNIMWTGPIRADTAVQALENAYAAGETDEFVTPTFIEGGRPIRKGDGVLFMNFRPDRARQLTEALSSKNFSEFDTGQRPDLDMATLTCYDSRFGLPAAYPLEMVKHGLGEYVSSLGLKQMRVAETEKYAHVTYFFSGGNEQEYDGERRLLIPSPKVLTYDTKPEMSAIPLTNGTLWNLDKGDLDLVIMNYANLDMVGHTGKIDATVKAVEAVDYCVGLLLKGCKESGYTLFITADHGNAEQMLDPNSAGPFTAHTLNPVPFLIISDEVTVKDEGILGDVAPTILDYMGLKENQFMTGKSLLIWEN